MCRCIDILGMYMCNIHTRRMVIDWQFPHELSLALEPSFEDWRPSSHFTSGAQKYERLRRRETKQPSTKTFNSYHHLHQVQRRMSGGGGQQHQTQYQLFRSAKSLWLESPGQTTAEEEEEEEEAMTLLSFA